MAEVKHEVSVTLTEQEAKLVAAVLQHVRLGSTGWNSVAADLAIALEPHFLDEELPTVDFTFEDRNGNEIQTSGIYVTVEVISAEVEL